MSYITIPGSRDIYLEINGQKVAVVESYKAKTTRENKMVEAMGESQPVGSAPGRTNHVISLSRVYLLKESALDEVDFYQMEDFNLVIVKPDRRIIYSGCQWYDITEETSVGDVCIESVSLTALRRLEYR